MRGKIELNSTPTPLALKYCPLPFSPIRFSFCTTVPPQSYNLQLSHSAVSTPLVEMRRAFTMATTLSRRTIRLFPAKSPFIQHSRAIETRLSIVENTTRSHTELLRELHEAQLLRKLHEREILRKLNEGHQKSTENSENQKHTENSENQKHTENIGISILTTISLAVSAFSCGLHYNYGNHRRNIA